MLLFIEPEEGASREPVIDSITRRMVAAFRRARAGKEECGHWRAFENDMDFLLGSYMGVHVCLCGARSRAFNYQIPSGQITNSLCIHYLAFHRAEVPDDQLALIALLDCGEAFPSKEELTGQPEGLR